MITPRTYTLDELATVPTIDLQYHYDQLLAEEIHRYKYSPTTTSSPLVDNQMNAVKAELVRRLGSAWRGGPAPSATPPVPLDKDGRPVFQVFIGGRQDTPLHRRH